MWLVYMLISQAVVVVIVILWLKVILERMLVDSAIRHFEYFSCQKSKPWGKALTVISFKKLKDQERDRILKAAERYLFEGLTPVFQIDRNLKGGMIIRTEEKMIDCSLRDRLEKALGKRSKL